MERILRYAPRLAMFVAGAAAAALIGPRRERGGMDAPVKELKRSLAELEGRLVSQETASAARFTQIEARLDEHAAKLAEAPSTAQIVAAMEQFLSKTMGSLDDRLTAQAQSIDVLKTTVSQTDSLLERVLESLDSLQAYTDPAELSQDTLLERSAA
jgi:chromosome segregation ATPase